MNPQYVASGQLIRAEHINAIVTALRQNKIRVGRGLTMQQTAGGVLLSLSHAEPDYWLRATVTEIVGGSAGVFAWPSAISYNLFVLDGGFTMTGVIPEWGRPVEGDEAGIYPAPPDKPCFVCFRPDNEGGFTALAWIEERTSFTLCTPKG